MKEHNRLNCPLQQLGYNGYQAQQHVTRLVGASDGAPEPPNEPVPQNEPELLTPATSGYDTRFLNGYWQLIQLDSEGQPGSAVELPPLDPSGEGWWRIVIVDDVPVAWQGGETEGIPCQDFFPAAEAAAGALVPYTGPDPAAALLPGMRLPQKDTPE